VDEEKNPEQKAGGGVTFDLTWKDGRLVKRRLVVLKSGSLRVRLEKSTRQPNAKGDLTFVLNERLESR